MIRVVLETLLVLLLPAFVYFAYAALMRGEDEDAVQIVREAPLPWLLLAGATLMIGMLSLFATESGGKPDQVYEPPALKDGQIVPGHMR